MISQVSGTFTVKMPKKPKTFTLVKGKLTVDGEPVELTPSDNENFPTTKGWLKFKDDSFVQITSEGSIKVVSKADKKDEILPIPVEKAKPVPVGSKCFLSASSNPINLIVTKPMAHV